MIDEIPAEDFHFLRRLYLVQPFGYRRDEFNTGLIASTIINSQRGPNSRAWSAYDMMPYTKFADKSRDVDAMNDMILRSLARGKRR